MAVTYRLLRSRRRTLAVQITAEGVLVRAPLGLPVQTVEAFLTEKRSWIEEQLRKRQSLPPFTGEELQTLIQQAARELPERVSVLADRLGVDYGRVTVRCQKTRWGSCSARGNLNFNCLLMLTPPQVRDYVIVHELCHRKELNHAPAFWHLVEQAVPDYRQHRRWLRENAPALIGRLPSK